MNPLDAVAVYRLTRLVTADSLLHRPREAVVRWAYDSTQLAPLGGEDTWADLAIADGPDAPKLATLVTCRWCASVWIAAGVLLARRWFPQAWPVVARLLTYSAGAALLARLED